MKRSTLTQLISLLCLLSFGMHAALHIGPAFSWIFGHAGHGNGHSLVSYGDSNTSPHGFAEFDASLLFAEQLGTSNHSHHAPSEHSPEPENHDPSHHLTIQYRSTNQNSSLPFASFAQHRLFPESSSTITLQRVVWTSRNAAVDFNPFVKCIRLTL